MQNVLEVPALSLLFALGFKSSAFAEPAADAVGTFAGAEEVDVVWPLAPPVTSVGLTTIVDISASPVAIIVLATVCIVVVACCCASVVLNITGIIVVRAVLTLVAPDIGKTALVILLSRGIAVSRVTLIAWCGIAIDLLMQRAAVKRRDGWNILDQAVLPFEMKVTRR